MSQSACETTDRGQGSEVGEEWREMNKCVLKHLGSNMGVNE